MRAALQLALGYALADFVLGTVRAVARTRCEYRWLLERVRA